jgi:hypothetical protein
VQRIELGGASESEVKAFTFATAHYCTLLLHYCYWKYEGTVCCLYLSYLQVTVRQALRPFATQRVIGASPGENKEASSSGPERGVGLLLCRVLASVGSFLLPAPSPSPVNDACWATN